MSPYHCINEIDEVYVLYVGNCYRKGTSPVWKQSWSGNDHYTFDWSSPSLIMYAVYMEYSWFPSPATISGHPYTLKQRISQILSAPPLNLGCNQVT